MLVVSLPFSLKGHGEARKTSMEKNGFYELLCNIIVLKLKETYYSYCMCSVTKTVMRGCILLFLIALDNKEMLNCDVLNVFIFVPPKTCWLYICNEVIMQQKSVVVLLVY